MGGLTSLCGIRYAPGSWGSSLHWVAGELEPAPEHAEVIPEEDRWPLLLEGLPTGIRVESTNVTFENCFVVGRSLGPLASAVAALAGDLSIQNSVVQYADL